MPEFLKLYNLSNRPTLPVTSSAQLAYILTDVEPGPRLADVRMPLNIVLLVDRSAGMGGETLRTVKKAISHLFDQLQSNDAVSLVTFGNQARVVIPAQSVGSGAQLQNWATGVRAAGKRNLNAGLHEALQQASQFELIDRITRIILILNGKINDTPRQLNKIFEEVSAAGYPLIGLGIGDEWDEDFLIELVDRSLQTTPGSRSGIVQYAAETKDVPSMLNTIHRMVQIGAQDVQLSLRLVRGVQVRNVWQIRPVLRELGPNVIGEESINIHVGELNGDGLNYLAEVVLAPRPAGSVRILQTDVSAAIPGFGRQTEREELVIQFSQNLAVTSRLDGFVMDMVQKAQSLKWQTQALNDADAGNPAGAVHKLRQVIPILMSQGEVDLADRMRKEIEHLEQEGALSRYGRKIIRLAVRGN